MTDPNIILGPDAPGDNNPASPINRTRTATTTTPLAISYQSGSPSYADRIAALNSKLGQQNVKVSAADFNETLAILNSCIQHYHQWTDDYGQYDSSLGNTNPDQYSGAPNFSNVIETTTAMHAYVNGSVSSGQTVQALHINFLINTANLYVNHNHSTNDRTL